MANERFEGLYGRLYTRVIQTRTLRRAVFSLWGSADPLLRLDKIIATAAAEAGDGTILDVPCGGGTLLTVLDRAGFRGTVIESDLAAAMMRRARATHQRLGQANVEAQPRA
jgi:2-polyprenyl-3-methyl-5-hydroxy-6-metoxy-1,4-benzoquinol methylase